MKRLLVLGLLAGIFWGTGANAETDAASAQQAVATAAAVPATTAPTVAQIEPYRTFVTIQRYVIDNNGNPGNPISNVRLQVSFPNGTEKPVKIALPEGGQYWPIGNSQVQEINRTFEIPWKAINTDGFRMVIQMERKGAKLLPCEFDVTQLSQFNRAYTCATDQNFQRQAGKAEEHIDKEGIQIRVFTSKNSLPKEIPQDALAIR